MQKYDVYELEDAAAEELKMLGVPFHISGFKVLEQAIVLCLRNVDMMRNMCTEFYPAVGKMVGMTDKNAERAMRYAITVCFDRGDWELLEKYFGGTICSGRGKATNSEFISIVADRIRRKLRKERLQKGSR